MEASWVIALTLIWGVSKQAVGQDVCGTSRWKSVCPTEELLEMIQTSLKSRLNVKIKVAAEDVDDARAQRDQIRRNAENRKKITDDFKDLVNMSLAAEETLTSAMIMDQVSKTSLKELSAFLNNAQEKSITFESSCKKNAYRKIYSKKTKRIMLLTGTDCSDIHAKGGRKNGFYYIRPVGATKLIQVYCDMKDSGGGWTVIQRRYNGHLDFDRDWEAYKWGFRRDDEKIWEYWIGNEYIHLLTQQNSTEMKITLLPWDGTERYALYKRFAIDDESSNYNLREISGYLVDSNGDVGDAMGLGSTHECAYESNGNAVRQSGHVTMDFTTRDRDNDNSDVNCAGHGRGGWWFNNCHAANLNGIRRRPGQIPEDAVDDGIIWTTWKGCRESLKGTVMKIRPSSFTPDRTPILPQRQDILRRQLNNRLKLTRRLSRRWRRSAHKRKAARSHLQSRQKLFTNMH